MFNYTSVKLRLAISVSINVLRAIIGFATGLLIARALDPSGYGDLMFLLGSFMAIRSLLDLGSSNAFFTFLSKRARGLRFYLAYFSWLLFQFVTTLFFLGLLIPSSMLEKIWLGHSREIVILAFVAAFMQQQLWQTVVQIGEAMRKTVKVQLMNLTVALMYLTVVLIVFGYGQLSLEKILFILIGQYAVAVVFAYRLLNKDVEHQLVDEISLGEILHDYWKYCRPMIALALVNFSYDFTNKWMLQKYGGATQQGYFQAANQFAAVSLFATTSILNVFWKEIAHAWEMQDRPRAAMLYCKVSRGLVMLGACVSGLLLPWSEQIVNLFLGSAYAHAWPVLAIMLLYPIHQSMGQIGGTMLLASGQTHRYMLVSVATMLISIPVTYIVLAPHSSVWLPGFEMGALGMACQMVLLGIVSVNVQAWVIARHGGWKYDWTFQALGIPLIIFLGFVAKILAEMYWDTKNFTVPELIAPVMIASLLYIMMVSIAILRIPWLIGSSRGEIEGLLGRVFHRKL